MSANRDSKDCKSFVEVDVWLLQENNLTLTIGESTIHQSQRSSRRAIKPLHCYFLKAKFSEKIMSPLSRHAFFNKQIKSCLAGNAVSSAAELGRGSH